MSKRLAWKYFYLRLSLVNKALENYLAHCSILSLPRQKPPFCVDNLGFFIISLRLPGRSEYFILQYFQSSV